MIHTMASRRRKALYTGAAFAVSASLLLTGCGRGGDGPAESGESTTIDDKPATGTLEIWTEGADGAKLPEMFEKFKEDNPDIDIKMTEIPGEEFRSKMTAAITAGTVPDLIYSFTESQAPLIATGGFDAVPDGLVEEDDFFPAMWENSLYDGVQYGVPWYTYANVSYYRSDLVEAAGAELPTDWDSLHAFGEKLKASGVEYPLGLYVAYDDYTAWQLGVFAAQNGGSFISEDGTEWTLNTPENVEALEFYSSLFKDGLASPDGPAFLDIVPWTSQGKNASIIDGGPWFASWFDDANGAGWGAEHLEFIQNPTGPTGIAASTTGGGSWFVPSDSENKDAAWKFARFMSEPESQIEWYKIFKNMPAVKAAWDDPALSSDPLLLAVRESLENGVNRPKVATWNQVGLVIGEQMDKVIRGNTSPQDALDEAQKQAEAIGMGTK